MHVHCMVAACVVCYSGAAAEPQFMASGLVDLNLLVHLCIAEAVLRLSSSLHRRIPKRDL